MSFRSRITLCSSNTSHPSSSARTPLPLPPPLNHHHPPPPPFSAGTSAYSINMHPSPSQLPTHTLTAPPPPLHPNTRHIRLWFQPRLRPHQPPRGHLGLHHQPAVLLTGGLWGLFQAAAAALHHTRTRHTHIHTAQVGWPLGVRGGEGGRCCSRTRHPTC